MEVYSAYGGYELACLRQKDQRLATELNFRFCKDIFSALCYAISKKRELSDGYGLVMDFCGSRRLLYQGLVRLCQYAGIRLGAGALPASYVSRVTEGGDSFKASINAVFIVDNTFRIVLYRPHG